MSPEGIAAFRVRHHALRTRDLPAFRARMLRQAVEALSPEDRAVLVDAMASTLPADGPDFCGWAETYSTELRVLMRLGQEFSAAPTLIVGAKRRRDLFVNRCGFLRSDERAALERALG